MIIKDFLALISLIFFVTLNLLTSDLVLEYKNGGNSATDNGINPHFRIVNNGDSAVKYATITIRYWFSSEDSNALTFWCDWAQIGTTAVNGTFGDAFGMNYLETRFDATTGSILARSNSGDIQTRFSKTNWSNFNEINDYSFDASKINYQSHIQATMYLNAL